MARARAGGALWTDTEHLLAAIVDELAIARYLFILANQSENAEKPLRPQPLPRPGVQAPEPDQDPASVYDTSHIPAINPSEVAAWLST